MPEHVYHFSGAEPRPQVQQDPGELALATRYAPIIYFDRHEPFLPSAVGYTILRQDGPSPSFPLVVRLKGPGRPAAHTVIEYAIWWDWDIQHLYELEHAWVYLDEAGQVVWAAASWHGGWNPLLDVQGHIPMEGEHIVLWSEPGKHAFGPAQERLLTRRAVTVHSCGRGAGTGGVWVTPLFEGQLPAKAPQADRLVHTYLERLAFTPSYDFSQRFAITPELLVPWPALRAYIPPRVDHWVAQLERSIPPHKRRVLNVAHRGASATAPENTLAAFTLAARLGADMVELDVQLTADGVPVVLHDALLERTTSGHGLVREHTLDQLQDLDAGAGQRIPVLTDVLDWARAQHMRLYIELKAPGTPAAVVPLIRERGMRHSTVLASFSHDLVAEVRELAPELETSILFSATSIDPVALAESCAATYVHPCWERLAEPHTLLTPAWLERVRAARRGIIAWHEERPAELAALCRLGLDGICTNLPDLLHNIAGAVRGGREPAPGADLAATGA